MYISVSGQAFNFVAMVICGVFCGIVFDFFRAIRRHKKIGRGIVVMQDLIFWLVELLVIYMVAFRLNYAHIRAYEGVALVAGSWIYFMTISKYALDIMLRLIIIIRRLTLSVAKPFCKIYIKVKTVVGFRTDKISKRLKGCYTKALDKTRVMCKKHFDLHKIHICKKKSQNPKKT